MTLDDKHLDRLFEEALRDSQREPAACPDVELLGAYYEHALGTAEASALEDHLAVCERCRGVVFDLGRASELPPLRETSFWPRWLPTLGTLAAATGAVVLAIRLFPDTQEVPVAEEPPAAQSSRLDDSSRFRENGAVNAPAAVAERQARAKQELRDGVGGKLAVEEKREAEKKKSQSAAAVAATPTVAAKPTVAPKPTVVAKPTVPVKPTVAAKPTVPVKPTVAMKPTAPAAAKATAAPAMAKAAVPPAAKPEAPAKERAATKDEESDALAGARRQLPVEDLNLKLAPDAALAVGEDARKGRLGATAAAPAENERVNVAPPASRSEKTAAPSDADKADAFANLQKMRDRTTAAPAVSAPAFEARAPATVGAAGEAAAMARTSQPARVFAADTKNAAFQWRVGRDGVERSEDGGASWATVALPTKAKIIAIASPRPPIAWAVGERGLVLRTLDGRTWQRIPTPTDEDLVSILAKSAEAATITTRSGQTFDTKSPTTLQTR